jgi:hypothetical protein
MVKLVGNNKHNITWLYAQQCWRALKNNDSIPPIPYYDTWENEETGGKGRIFTGKELIEPCSVSYGEITLFRE